MAFCRASLKRSSAAWAEKKIAATNVISMAVIVCLGQTLENQPPQIHDPFCLRSENKSVGAKQKPTC